MDARGISSIKDERVAASKALTGPKPAAMKGDVKAFVNDVRAALYCSKICSYAQGFAMIAAANGQFKYGMKLDEIARIWKAGCIIRAIFLDEIKKAFREHPALNNLLMTNRFREAIAQRQDAWRRIIVTGAQNGIGLPAFAASLAYYDSYRRERLPANLIQAQRDFFGAHTYERTDKPGAVHTEWSAQTPEGKSAEAHQQDVMR